MYKYAYLKNDRISIKWESRLLRRADHRLSWLIDGFSYLGVGHGWGTAIKEKKDSFKNAVEGFWFHKIHTEKKKYESPEEVPVLKILISTGDSYFKI